MTVTDVIIQKKEGNRRTIAQAAVTLDDCIAIHGISIIEGRKGRFIAMPSHKISPQVYLDIVHPTNTETRRMIEQAIFKVLDAEN